MISFALPKALSWNGVEVPTDFPYLSVIFQGPPKHSRDDFSLRHPKMELGKRAKIFSPFDALDGYSDAVRSKDVEYVEKIDLTKDGLAEEDREELSRRLEILHNLTYTGRQARANRVVVTVTYFVPCEDENSFAFGVKGLYKSVTGVCWKVDFIQQTVTVGEATIPLDGVVSIESTDEVFDIEWETEGA